MEGEGVGFIMEGWEIFKVSLHSWQRGTNPLFYEDPLLYCLPTSFFKFRYGTLPFYQTHKHTTYSGASRQIHPYKIYICTTCYVLTTPTFNYIKRLN